MISTYLCSRYGVVEGHGQIIKSGSDYLLQVLMYYMV